MIDKNSTILYKVVLPICAIAIMLDYWFIYKKRLMLFLGVFSNSSL